MTETRLKELQTEIARLKELDDRITKRVAAEFDAEIKVPCSSKLDYKWANQSL